MRAWVARQQIDSAADFPPAPQSVREMYDVHLCMQTHALAADLGGHGGYKIGAVGAEGEIRAHGLVALVALLRRAPILARLGARPLGGGTPWEG